MILYILLYNTATTYGCKGEEEKMHEEAELKEASILNHGV